MSRYIFYTLLLSVQAIFAQEHSPSAFIGISAISGSHNIVFKSFDDAPGFSFGFNFVAGIYAINNESYRGGLAVNITEGASRNLTRRALSETFVLPNQKFDKHIIFNFAQFRGSSIGWFSEWPVKSNFAFFHQLGTGIFGTTEKDQLYDFALHHQAGILIDAKIGFQWKLGFQYDHTFGTGNPNYLQNQLALTIRGSRRF